MLIAPPPGYAPSAINRQRPQGLEKPGEQGMETQGYTPAAPAGTMLPSSYSPPSASPLPMPPVGSLPNMPPFMPEGGNPVPNMDDAMMRRQTPNMPQSFMNAVGARPPGMPGAPGAMPMVQAPGAPPMPPNRGIGMGGNPLGAQNIPALLSLLSRGGPQR